MSRFRLVPRVQVLSRREPLALLIRWGRWNWYYRGR